MAECRDYKCTDGVTACAGCNGFGVLRVTLKKYRVRTGAKNMVPHAPAHAVCHGTGLVPCGCVPLDDATRTALTPDVEIETRYLQPGALVRDTTGTLLTVEQVELVERDDQRRVVWRDNTPAAVEHRNTRWTVAGAAAETAPALVLVS